MCSYTLQFMQTNNVVLISNYDKNKGYVYLLLVWTFNTQPIWKAIQIRSS